MEYNNILHTILECSLKIKTEISSKNGLFHFRAEAGGCISSNLNSNPFPVLLQGHIVLFLIMGVST